LPSMLSSVGWRMLLKLCSIFAIPYHIIWHCITDSLKLCSQTYELTKAVGRNLIRHYKLTMQIIIVLTLPMIVRYCLISVSAGHQLSRMFSLEEHFSIIPRLGHVHFLIKSFPVFRPPIVLILHKKTRNNVRTIVLHN
jgi:hypothetical protein